MPLGAPGLIAFSGVCVGRGYVNDPERTRQAYLADPHRPGQRLYLGGDYGRWRPDGKLEFLGRRDSQVKISGFRIEIGEIENTLLRVPGVRDGAVVVAGRPGQGQRLVAFYSGPRPLEADALRDRLGGSLPGYMVPAAFHWRESLPLTANSKIDKKALTALAGELGDAAAGADTTRRARPPSGGWRRPGRRCSASGQDQIGRRDNFFDRGGTSLSAVKLAIALDRAVSLKDLTRHPVLADMAALIDGKSNGRKSGGLRAAPAAAGTGRGPGAALVCFPYAGGNAVNFQSMASALRGSGLAVYAVELPGHDLGPREVSRSRRWPRWSAQVAAEITGRGLSRVLLWGHSSGAAFALATAMKLAEHGVEVQRVFLGAQLPGDAAARRAGITELTGRSNAEIAADSARTAATPSSASWTRSAPADRRRLPARLRVRAPVSRRRPGRPAAVRLSAPVTVVVAADDPYTADSADATATGSFLPSRSTCTSSPTAATTSCAPARPRRPRPCCGRRTGCRPARLLALDGRDIDMSHSSLASSWTWSCSQASPRWCGPRPAVTRPTGPPGTVTRCAPWSPSTAASWSAGSGCATRPGPAPSSSGWRPA